MRVYLYTYSYSYAYACTRQGEYTCRCRSSTYTTIYILIHECVIAPVYACHRGRVNLGKKNLLEPIGKFQLGGVSPNFTRHFRNERLVFIRSAISRASRLAARKLKIVSSSGRVDGVASRRIEETRTIILYARYVRRVASRRHYFIYLPIISRFRRARIFDPVENRSDTTRRDDPFFSFFIRRRDDFEFDGFFRFPPFAFRLALRAAFRFTRCRGR